MSQPIQKDKRYPNILLVEDNAADVELIKMQVKSIWPDHEIYVAASLSKAYEIYSSMPLDLVLLDLNLPDGFGPRSVEEVMAFSRKIPVLVITGMGSNLTLNEAMRYGASGVIFKDKLMTDEFKETLRNTIKN